MILVLPPVPMEQSKDSKNFTILRLNCLLINPTSLAVFPKNCAERHDLDCFFNSFLLLSVREKMDNKLRDMVFSL